MNDFLRLLRIKRGKTLRDVSKETGINLSTIARIERGELELTDAYVHKLSKSLNTNEEILRVYRGSLPRYFDSKNKNYPDVIEKELRKVLKRIENLENEEEPELNNYQKKLMEAAQIVKKLEKEDD